jgi:UDP-N-acetyl-D-glucosamine dehydrogenase
MIADKDCVIITTAHSSYDIERIAKHAKLIVDTRNATKSVSKGRDKIVRLGCGT